MTTQQILAFGAVEQQMFGLSLVCVTIALVTDSLWGLAAGTARAWFIDSPRRLERARGGRASSWLASGSGSL